MKLTAVVVTGEANVNADDSKINAAKIVVLRTFCY